MTVGGGVHGQSWEGLRRFLQREVFPGAQALRIEQATRPTGGASWETWVLVLSLRTGATDETRRVVVKRAPATGPLAPYEVSKDVAIFSTLADSDVPVPRLLGWTEDPEVFERPFTLTSFVEGESHDITKVETWPIWQADRTSLGYEIIDTLAALQRVHWQGTSLEQALGPIGSAAERVAGVVDRFLDPLLEAAARRGVGVPLWRDMGHWIKTHAPSLAADEMVVVHGDYRFGNFLWQGSSMAAVLDWERAMLGPPMQDPGFICMPLSRRAEPEIMGKALPFDALARRYEDASGRAVDVPMIQYYAVLWQFIEGVNAARGALARSDTPQVSSGTLAQPNLVARQTLRLMEDFECGRAEL